jgi:hypothetical protein
MTLQCKGNLKYTGFYPIEVRASMQRLNTRIFCHLAPREPESRL